MTDSQKLTCLFAQCTRGTQLSANNANVLVEKYDLQSLQTVCRDVAAWLSDERSNGRLHSEQSVLAEFARRRKSLPMRNTQKMEAKQTLTIDTLLAMWRRQVVGGWEPPAHILEQALRTYGFRSCASAINQTAGKYEREGSQMKGFGLEKYFLLSCRGYAERRNVVQRYIPTRQYGWDDFGNELR